MVRAQGPGSYRRGWVLVGLAAMTGLVALLMVAGPALTLLSAVVTDPLCPTPCSERLELRSGTYVVFEQVGTTVGGGGFSYTRTGRPSITPADVRVTGPGDTALAATPMPSSSSQDLNRDGAVFVGVARLRVPVSGWYRVQVSAPSPTAVVVAPDIGRTFLRALPGVGVGVLAGLLGSAGLVSLVLVWSRRRRTDVADGPHSPML